ncbi:MAG: hypothetical protein ABSB78_04285 [Bacteroidota bacterium]
MYPQTVIYIILDGVGISELADAVLHNDQRSDAFGNLGQAVGPAS